jgi:hypothetical protein
VKLASLRLLRRHTDKKRGNFGYFWSQLIRDDFYGHGLRTDFETLVDKDHEGESVVVQYRLQRGQIRS